MAEPAVDRPNATGGAPLPEDGSAAAEALAAARIEAALRRARLALFWEALWPRLVPLLCLGALFLVASWLGLFPALPDFLRFSLVALFGVSALLLLVPLLRIRWPDRAAAMDRLVRESGTPHRPVAAFSDRLAAPSDDPLTLALWQGASRKAAGRPRPPQGGLALAGHDRARPACAALSRAAAARRRLDGGLGRPRAAHRRCVPAGDHSGRGRAAHRRLGDAAGLYRAPADLPDGRRRPRRFRRRPRKRAGRLDRHDPHARGRHHGRRGVDRRRQAHPARNCPPAGEGRRGDARRPSAGRAPLRARDLRRRRDRPQRPPAGALDLRRHAGQSADDRADARAGRDRLGRALPSPMRSRTTMASSRPRPRSPAPSRSRRATLQGRWSPRRSCRSLCRASACAKGMARRSATFPPIPGPGRK